MKILFGYLRRDLMYLGNDANHTEDNPWDSEEQVNLAVKQGRAQIAFVVEAEAFASASDVNWANPDTHVVTGRSERPSSVPALNPHHGEQEQLSEEGASPETTIRENIREHSENSPKGPNTGTNPDGTPAPNDGKVPDDKANQSTDSKQAAIDKALETK
jgi:hypothetical protein